MVEPDHSHLASTGVFGFVRKVVPTEPSLPQRRSYSYSMRHGGTTPSFPASPYLTSNGSCLRFLYDPSLMVPLPLPPVTDVYQDRQVRPTGSRLTALFVHRCRVSIVLFWLHLPRRSFLPWVRSVLHGRVPWRFVSSQRLFLGSVA